MRLSLALALLLCTAFPAHADLFSGEQLRLFGDFRARLESDWDSTQTDGVTEREDRTRVRARLRLGLTYRPDERLELGLRLRSGSDASHQSPHITLIDLDDNDTGDVDFNFDRWYVALKGGRFDGWIGRNSHPFWRQNEIFWDDDVTPLGVAARYRSGPFALNAGAFAMPVGMRESSGTLLGAQALYAPERFTLAAGWYGYDADPDDPQAALLLDGDGLRDYSSVVLAAQLRPAPGWEIGVEHIFNSEDYLPTEIPTRPGVTADDDTGWVFQLSRGRLDERGDQLFAYTWIRIEALAFNGSYGEDDWVRWGSATETRSTDLEGHELRYARQLAGQLRLVVRLFVGESIVNGEDGKRARVDLDLRF